MKKWAKNTHGNFTEENLQSGQVLKRCSTKLIAGEMQIKTTYYYFPPTGLVKGKGGCFQLKVSET